MIFERGFITYWTETRLGFSRGLYKNHFFSSAEKGESSASRKKNQNIHKTFLCINFTHNFQNPKFLFLILVFNHIQPKINFRSFLFSFLQHSRSLKKKVIQISKPVQQTKRWKSLSEEYINTASIQHPYF